MVLLLKQLKTRLEQKLQDTHAIKGKQEQCVLVNIVAVQVGDDGLLLHKKFHLLSS